MLNELIKEALLKYPTIASGPFASTEETRIITERIPEAIRKSLFLGPEYKVVGSCGKGNWAEVPWVAVLNEKVTTSTREGYYIVYLFDPSNSAVYLSLAIGWTQFWEELGIPKGKEQIIKISAFLAKQLRNVPDGFSPGSIHLSAQGALAKGYELGQVLSKRYLADDLTDERVLFNDLRTLLGTYEELTKYAGNSVLNLHIEEEQAEVSEEERKIAVASLNENVQESLAGLVKLADALPVSRREALYNKIIRNRRFAEFVKQRAHFVCEVCGREPFVQFNGKLYAEADHIIPLGERGVDHPDNMRCLCAQCHAVLTNGSEEEQEDLFKAQSSV